MNGIHDMGGMQGMGEIGYRECERGFHEPWELRAFALVRAMGLGSLRQYIERIPASDYLRMSYYERWYTALVTQIVERGIVTRAEVESGRSDSGSETASPALTPEAAQEVLFRIPQEEQDIPLTSRFHVGDRVRGRTIYMTKHTRMPRYTFGRMGVVQRDRGVFNLPGSENLSANPNPQHVYLIRYDANELWGQESSPYDSLYIDMWEDYLEPS